uniref:Uncharacterized protein n=1 Tax=Rhizophora mucronata TaxID=61149 RepID=A0A2P2IPV1_RHIMU
MINLRPFSTPRSRLLLPSYRVLANYARRFLSPHAAMVAASTYTPTVITPPRKGS